MNRLIRGPLDTFAYVMTGAVLGAFGAVALSAGLAMLFAWMRG